MKPAASRLVVLLALAVSLGSCSSNAVPPPAVTVGEVYQLVLASPGQDTDGDCIPDDVELHPLVLTDPDDEDTDGDSILDTFEVFGRSFLFVATDGRAGELYEDDPLPDANADGRHAALDPLDGCEEQMVDSDGDGVYNYLEYYGYTYDWPTGRFIPWTPADRAAHPEVAWYRTDPLQPSTDQDAYPDGMEVSGVKMDVAVSDPGRHPLVPAYPNIVVKLEGYTLTLNEEVTYEDGGSVSKGTSWSRETKAETAFASTYGQEIGGEGGLDKDGLSVKVHATLTFGQSTTNTTGTAVSVGSSVNEEINWNRARCYNRTAAARIKLLLKVENQGSAPASNVVPTISLRIGGANVATFAPADFVIKMLMPGGVFPEGEGIYWVVDSTPTGPLTLTEWELKALENGAPINIAVPQMSADVMRMDEHGAWEPAGDVGEYVARCREVSASLFAEVGPGRYMHHLVYAAEGATAPEVTLRDALRWAMGSKEQGGDTYITYEDGNGGVEQLKLTNQAGEGWAVHMDQITHDRREPGQHPFDVRLHRDAHIELVAPRASDSQPPSIFTAYAVPLEDGWDVVACASDYDGIEEVVFIDRFGGETKMEPDGRGPWFFSCRIGSDYEFSTYGSEGVRVTSLNEDAPPAQCPVEVIHTVVSQPPRIGRLRFDAQNNRLEVKVEPGGELAEDEVDDVFLYHPDFLAAVTGEDRDGYIKMVETIYWFEDPFVYECVIPGGWTAGMRVVAKTKGGMYATLGVGSIPTLVPYGSGDAGLGTKVYMTFYGSRADWHIQQVDLDRPGAGNKAPAFDLPVEATNWGSEDLWPRAVYFFEHDLPDDYNEGVLVPHFPYGDVYARSMGDYDSWNSYLLVLQHEGMKADPAAAGKAGPAFYEELTLHDAQVLSAQFVPGGEFPAEEDGVYVFRTDQGRLGKLIIRKIERWRQNALLPSWHYAKVWFDYTIFRKAGDGTMPAPFAYDPDTASYSRGTAIATNRPLLKGAGDPADEFAIMPSLPAGLHFDTETGAISGTPTASAAAQDYTVTASNTKGSRETVVNIEVLEPPSNLSYPTPIVCATGETVPDKSPTVSGTADHYSVSPALPAGVTLDAGTGVIGGTPTEVTQKTDYTVTASNRAGGSTTAVVSIETPLGPPMDLSYAVASAAYAVGTTIVANAPTVTNPVASYTVDPALPDGLTIHATSGVISGQPTATSLPTTYTITATNAAGSTTTTITIEVNGSP